MNRRSFLIRALIFLIALAPLGFLPWIDWKSLLKRIRKSSGYSEQDWQVLEAVQEHLFPSESDSPGSKKVQALNYLQRVLAHEELDAEDREHIHKGLTVIEALSQEMAKQPFASLATKQREAVLRRFEKTEDGESWLITVLNYIFEALLGDPAYGGNPKGIAWKWLGLRPGFPRPPIGKRYYELR